MIGLSSVTSTLASLMRLELLYVNEIGKEEEEEEEM